MYKSIKDVKKSRIMFHINVIYLLLYLFSIH